MMAIEASMAHWAMLAEQADEADAWDRKMGYGPPGMSPKNHQAVMFRRQVEALKLEQKTGMSHCCCCLKARGKSLYL